MLKTSYVVPSPNRQKSKNCARGIMLLHGSAIRPWPSGKIMAATPRTPEVAHIRAGYIFLMFHAGSPKI